MVFCSGNSESQLMAGNTIADTTSASSLTLNLLKFLNGIIRLPSLELNRTKEENFFYQSQHFFSSKYFYYKIYLTVSATCFCLV